MTRRPVALDQRDRALLVLAGVLVIVAMACVTALILWSDSDGVAAGIGVFTAAATVAGTAVGRISPATAADPAVAPASVAVDPDGGVFTTPEVP